MPRTAICSRIARCLTGLLAVAFLATTAHAQVDWAYTAIADSSGELASFSLPAINDAGQVAFVAAFDDPAEGQAVYRYDGPGVLTPIATTGANGIASFPGNPAINSAGVVTVAATLADGSTSILAGSGGALSTVANTLVDGLSSLDSKPFVGDAGGVVVVRGVRTSDGARVILTGTGAAAPAVLVASTGSYDPVDVAGINDDGAVAFEATTGAGATRGIYRTVDGVAVTTISEVPVGGGEDLQGLDLDNNGAVAWFALDNLGIQRLYTTLSGSPVNFVNTAGPFDTLGAASVAENGSLAFRATLDLGLDAIFAGGTSLYERATAIGDTLLGAAITALDIGPDAVTSSGAFVFRASRTNATSGIYVAIGTPVDNSDGGSSAVDPMALGALLLLSAWRRRR